MHFSRSGMTAAVVAMATSLAISAQDMGSMGGSPQMMEHLTQVFGKTSAFSVTMKAETKDPQSGKVMKLEMPMSYLAGQARTELDFAKMGASAGGEQDGAAAAMAQMAAMGMDKMISITVPEKNMVYMIIPGLKGYCEIKPPAAPADAAGKEPKLEIVDLGKETVDGHACTKKQIKQAGAPAGEKVLWWAATDLKDMPIKAEISTADGNAATLHFTNYNFAKPAASLFTVPAGLKKYNSMQELMMSGMANMMQGK